MEKIGQLLVHRRLSVMAAGLGMILVLPFLGLGFQVDDYFHRAAFLEPAALDGLFGSPFSSLFNFADGDAERTNELVARGMFPWFTQPEVKIHYWRPLTVATHWLDYTLWPDAPWLMHVQSLLWFGAAIFLVSVLYRRLMGPALAAGIASVLFAIDDAHSLPAGWIANRNSLVALVFGVSALILHDRWRSEGKTRLAPLAFALFALALLAKEGAIAVCAYLFAYAVVLERGPWLRRMGSLVPYGIIVILWRAYYQSSGYGASGSSALVDPLTSPLMYLRGLSFRAPLFLTGQFAFPPTDFHTFSPPSAQPYFVLWSVAVLIVLLPFFIPLVRKQAIARFWALGLMLCLIPICSTGPMDRLLDFCGIGAMGLLGQFFVAVRAGELRVSTGWLRRGLRPVYWIMFSIHVVVAPLLFVGMMYLFAFASGIAIDAVDRALPRDEDLSEKTVILANASNYPIGFYLFLFRALSDAPAPAALRSLAPPSIALVPLEIERIGETSLRVDFAGDFDLSLFRGEAHFEQGDRVELKGLTVEVVEVGPDGWPRSLLYHFDVPLEDPSLIWLEVQIQDVRPWSPPAIGESVRLNDS